MIPLLLFLTLKISLAMWDCVCFFAYFRVICPSSLKNAIAILTGIALSMQIALYIIVHFKDINCYSP